MSHITATFESRPEAESVLADLENAGVREDQISLVVTEESRGNHFRIEERSRADEGVAAGATFGGIVGALLGSVLAAGTIAVPGLNLVVVGSLASGLAGLGAGAAAGGLVGALIGAGMTEHEARLHEDDVKSGNILLAVRPDTPTQKAHIEDILRNSEAHSVAD
jgi:hypothetical protein